MLILPCRLHCSRVQAQFAFNLTRYTANRTEGAAAARRRGLLAGSSTSSAFSSAFGLQAW